MKSYDQSKVLSLVEELLGTPKQLKNNEYSFYCPACNHYKRKLQVNISSDLNKAGQWHCWVCEDINRTKGKSFKSLFRKFHANDSQMAELSKAVGDISLVRTEIQEKQEQILALPNEFIPLWEKNNSIFYNHARLYLKKRNITPDDILKYGIGYCESGKFDKRIIIPSYDGRGQLNYFTARSYYSNSYYKYMNPEATKDVIGFELFINWKLPIILVEGVFDAIAVKRNAIPLYGKTIPKSLREKIAKNDIRNIYISLDKDALPAALKICQEMVDEGRNVYFIDLQEKDPSEVGFSKFWEIVEQTRRLTFYDLVKYKMR
jgi:hypothetical protein